MPDLIPRRKVIEATLNVFEGDLDKLRKVIHELNATVDDGEGTFLEEDVFQFMVHLFEEHMKKTKRKSKSSKRTTKTNSSAAAKETKANPKQAPSLDLGGKNAEDGDKVPPPPFKLT